MRFLNKEGGGYFQFLYQIIPKENTKGGGYSPVARPPWFMLVRVSINSSKVLAADREGVALRMQFGLDYGIPKIVRLLEDYVSFFSEVKN